MTIRQYKQKRVLVSKEFTFDSSHNLEDYEGKCKHLHGHTYKVIYGVSSHLDDIGMSLDFGVLKDFHKGYIDKRLDHKYLNDAFSQLRETAGMNTTAENMAMWIYDTLDSFLLMSGYSLSVGARVEFIRLYETPTSFAEVRREWMIDE